MQGCLPNCLSIRIHGRVVRGTLHTSSLREVVRVRSLCLGGITNVLSKAVPVSSVQRVSSLTQIGPSCRVPRAGRRGGFMGSFRRTRGCGLTILSPGPIPASNIFFCGPMSKIISSRCGTGVQRCNISLITTPGRDILTALSNAIIFTNFSPGSKGIVRIRREGNFLSVCGRGRLLLGRINSHIITKRTVTLMNGAKGLSANPRLRFRL